MAANVHLDANRPQRGVSAWTPAGGLAVSKRVSYFLSLKRIFLPSIHDWLLIFRRAVVKELVETEEEFGRDLQQVVERYLKPLDNPDVPRAVRDNKDIIFTNLKQIADFHNTYVWNGDLEKRRNSLRHIFEKKREPYTKILFFFTKTDYRWTRFIFIVVAACCSEKENRDKMFLIRNREKEEKVHEHAHTPHTHTTPLNTTSNTILFSLQRNI